MTENEILEEAAVLIAIDEEMRVQARILERKIRKLCREYDLATGTRGFAPFHMRLACEARGILAKRIAA